MGLTTAGRNFIAAAIVNDSSPAFYTNAVARIGVGDSTATFDAAHTDLQGTNKTRNAMESTYPQIATNELTFRSSYAVGEANHAWQEWGIFNAATVGTMLSRKVEDLGTKSGGTWVLTVTLTLALG